MITMFTFVCLELATNELWDFVYYNTELSNYGCDVISLVACCAIIYIAIKAYKMLFCIIRNAVKFVWNGSKNLFGYIKNAIDEYRENRIINE